MFYDPAHSNKVSEKPQVYLTGADQYQWALREDYNQTIAAAKEIADFVDITKAEIIHSVYWEALKSIPQEKLSAVPVICNLSGEWSRYEQDAGAVFLDIAAKVDIWIVRSQKAMELLLQKGYHAFYIPYTVDTNVFRPLNDDERSRIRNRLKLPEKKYIIGNFMRDSTAGRICSPKLVKGPDLFVEIVSRLHKKGHPVHVLLAGPRRHWIRSRLHEERIPYTFAGYKVWFDDMRINTLPRKTLNELYNILNLSLVSSRSEAGPHAILEAAATRCPQISSRVGIAEDVLESVQIYDCVDEAVAKIETDILHGELSIHASANCSHILSRNTAESCAKSYQEAYCDAVKASKAKREHFI